MERQASSRLGGVLERLQSFRGLEKQRSLRLGAGGMEKQQSFKERKSKESPGKRGDTALHLAARSGSAAHAQRALAECAGEEQRRELVARQNQDGETALYVAAEKGHLDAVKEILGATDAASAAAAAAVKANNSYDAFHIAAKQGHLDVLKEFLQAFPSLAMTTNSVNATALDTAATQGHAAVVDLLLDSDASLARIARNNGKTALHAAARAGHVDVVRSLQLKDPGIGQRTDKKGQTALHMAAKGQNTEIVAELLKPDMSIVNMEDNKGNRPIHVATRKGKLNVLQFLLTVDEIDVNAVNRAGETALGIAEKLNLEEIADVLRDAGGVAVKEPATPGNPARQLKQTVSDIKHDVESQKKQSRQTRLQFQQIKKRLHKLHISGLNNAINSNTVVAVLIATVAFAAIFTVPGQFAPADTPGLTPGQAYIADDPAFIVFLVFDALALFISLAVVVVQTSLIVVEQEAKKLMVFVMNKLMWVACLFVSVSFVSLTYVVVGSGEAWLAWSVMAIGTVIMVGTLGAMCYCIITHRVEERKIRRTSTSKSTNWSMPDDMSDPEMLNNEYKVMYAL